MMHTQAAKKIPVILDTDIGDDIDDLWAMVMLLRSPEVDVKLITTDTGDTTYRAKIVAKMLQIAGRTDIPIGVGPANDGYKPRMKRWVAEVDLAAYPGVIHQDGAGAMVNTIMGSAEPMTLIAIGPLPTVAAALERQPRIVDHCRFIGMHGSVRRGYHNSEKISNEYNVKKEVPAAKKVFTAAWDMTITPLDTCGLVQLDGQLYQQFRKSDDPVIKGLIEATDDWAKDVDWYGPDFDIKKTSSTLYDTVAIYLAFSRELVAMETVPLVVDDEGYTRIHSADKEIHCALQWKDLDAYEAFLTDRLLGRH